jgi:hypothetical protein
MLSHELQSCIRNDGIRARLLRRAGTNYLRDRSARGTVPNARDAGIAKVDNAARKTLDSLDTLKRLLEAAAP